MREGALRVRGGLHHLRVVHLRRARVRHGWPQPVSLLLGRRRARGKRKLSSSDASLSPRGNPNARERHTALPSPPNRFLPAPMPGRGRLAWKPSGERRASSSGARRADDDDESRRRTLRLLSQSPPPRSDPRTALRAPESEPRLPRPPPPTAPACARPSAPCLRRPLFVPRAPLARPRRSCDAAPRSLSQLNVGAVRAGEGVARLFCLRDPHGGGGRAVGADGRSRWGGDWSARSTRWTPEVSDDVSHKDLVL